MRAAVIFCVGPALSSYVANQALHSIRTTRDIDYPKRGGSGALQVEMHGIEEAFNSAVGDNDKKAWKRKVSVPTSSAAT